MAIIIHPFQCFYYYVHSPSDFLALKSQISAQVFIPHRAQRISSHPVSAAILAAEFSKSLLRPAPQQPQMDPTDPTITAGNRISGLATMTSNGDRSTRTSKTAAPLPYSDLGRKGPCSALLPQRQTFRPGPMRLTRRKRSCIGM